MWKEKCYCSFVDRLAGNNSFTELRLHVGKPGDNISFPLQPSDFRSYEIASGLLKNVCVHRAKRAAASAVLLAGKKRPWAVV